MEAPYALLWARYSFFIVLYPLGVASEMTMAYLALPVIRSTAFLSVMICHSEMTPPVVGCKATEQI